MEDNSRKQQKMVWFAVIAIIGILFFSGVLPGLASG